MDRQFSDSSRNGVSEAAYHQPLGHHTVITPRTLRLPDALPAEVVARFDGVDVTDVSDAVGQLYTMDFGIKPLYQPSKRILGEALTVKVPPGDNWAIHGALRQARPGSVLVVDSRGYVGGCGSGVLALVRAIRTGLSGVVIDGAWRDVGELRAIDFPVYGRAVSAFSPGKREMGEINVAVCCGGVIVEPGDLVVGDAEGVAVVPRRAVQAVADALPTPERISSIDNYPSDEELEKGVGEISSAYEDAFEERGGITGQYGGEE